MTHIFTRFSQQPQTITWSSSKGSSSDKKVVLVGTLQYKSVENKTQSLTYQPNNVFFLPLATLCNASSNRIMSSFMKAHTDHQHHVSQNCIWNYTVKYLLYKNLYKNKQHTTHSYMCLNYKLSFFIYVYIIILDRATLHWKLQFS